MASLGLFSFPLCLRSRARVHIVSWGGRQADKMAELFLSPPRTGL